MLLYGNPSFDLSGLKKIVMAACEYFGTLKSTIAGILLILKKDENGFRDSANMLSLRHAAMQQMCDREPQTTPTVNMLPEHVFDDGGGFDMGGGDFGGDMDFGGGFDF